MNASVVDFYTPQQIELLKQSSHSSTETLYSCPRRFELDKLLKSQRETTATFDFGHAVGAGVQSLLATGDMDQAVWQVFQNWTLPLDDDSEGNKKKTFFHAVGAVDAFQFIKNNELSEWRVMEFNGKPACELGFRIDLGDGFYYRGFLDAALQHIKTGVLGTLECKTTGLQNPNEAQWKNSSQGVGYALVLDSIAEAMGIPEGSQYNVKYPVYSSVTLSWQVFDFAKTYSMRADFIQQLMYDKAVVQMYMNGGKFPKRGSGCYAFFKQCDYFDTCQLSNKYMLKANPEMERKISEQDKKGYDFEFTLDQLIDAQLRRIKDGNN